MTGEELYERIYDARVDGKIGTTGVPWNEVSASEKQAWSRIARDDVPGEAETGPNPEGSPS
jgi:hypothetical protein